MTQETTAKQPKPKKAKHKSEERGDFKIGIYFIQHTLRTALYLHSTKRQDKNNNVFVRRMKDKIENGEWKGKVNHATIYHQGQPFLVYTDWNGQWEAPAPKQ